MDKLVVIVVGFMFAATLFYTGFVGETNHSTFKEDILDQERRIIYKTQSKFDKTSFMIIEVDGVEYLAQENGGIVKLENCGE